jgi:polygalacturonase
VELRERDGVALPLRPGLLVRGRPGTPGVAAAFGLAAALGCHTSPEIAAWSYLCGAAPTAPAAAGGAACGAGDPLLPPEPTLPQPADVCQTLVADKATADESRLDTVRVQAALTACKGRAVKLVTGGDGALGAFVVAHLNVDAVTLWIDAGVTLYASRDAELYQKTGNCGVPGVNDSGACTDFITVSGTRPAIVGDGTIDGQGGEPLVGHDYSWWQLSNALRTVDGSIGNPTLINLAAKTSGFVLYRVTLHDPAKFHVKITSVPPDGTCTTPGEGYIVWGITILTPSRWFNSQGLVMSPHFARNTDGVDPGTTDIATCGVIACNTISTGDDQIAVKGGHWVSDLVIAHNRFGTGHGMSIGSETYGTYTSPDGVQHRGVENVTVYDLTIDADSRPVGEGSSAADSNGIRVKSDSSRGGLVDNITFRDICMRDMANAILVSTAYNPLFAGTLYPDFRRMTFQNIRHVSCMNTQQPVVTLEGFNAVHRTGPITLDNVVVDNMGPGTVAAEYADITLGPRGSSFRPVGPGVALTDAVTVEATPAPCTFPPLTVPERPPGWLH